MEQEDLHCWIHNCAKRITDPNESSPLYIEQDTQTFVFEAFLCDTHIRKYKPKKRGVVAVLDKRCFRESLWPTIESNKIEMHMNASSLERFAADEQPQPQTQPMQMPPQQPRQQTNEFETALAADIDTFCKKRKQEIDEEQEMYEELTTKLRKFETSGEIDNDIFCTKLAEHQAKQQRRQEWIDKLREIWGTDDIQFLETEALLEREKEDLTKSQTDMVKSIETELRNLQKSIDEKSEKYETTIQMKMP